MPAARPVGPPARTSMYRLIYQDGDTPQAYTFTAGEVVIGRSPDCQVVLKDFGISRTPRQASSSTRTACASRTSSPRTAPRSTACPWSRRPSRTATASCSASSSSPSARRLEGKVVLDEAKPLSEEAGTIIRSVGRAVASSSPTPAQRGAAARGGQEGAADVQEIEKSNRILKVLTKVAETLIAVRPVEEVLQQVMDIVFDHVPADRGFLMLNEDGSDKLVPMVVKHRNAELRRPTARSASPRPSPTAS